MESLLHWIGGKKRERRKHRVLDAQGCMYVVYSHSKALVEVFLLLFSHF